MSGTDGAYISAFNTLQSMRREDIEIYHYRDTAAFSVLPHRHDFYELYCLLADSLTYHVEGSRCPLRPGRLLLVRPGETHWPEVEGPPRDIERIVLWLNPRFVSSLSVFLPGALGPIEAIPPKARLLVPEENSYQVILGLLYSLLYEKNRADADSLYLCQLILSQLLIQISRVLREKLQPPRKAEARNAEIRKVYEYINAHFREPLSVSALALRFFMDKNTMTRQFSRAFGLTPGVYIRRKRLEAARTLIRQGYGAQYAGFASGFADYSSFYRAFRQRYGTAPGDLSAAAPEERDKPDLS